LISSSTIILARGTRQRWSKHAALDDVAGAVPLAWPRRNPYQAAREPYHPQLPTSQSILASRFRPAGDTAQTSEDCRVGWASYTVKHRQARRALLRASSASLWYLLQ
jgi:hypothetical protein